jgi:hypothetical protein
MSKPVVVLVLVTNTSHEHEQRYARLASGTFLTRLDPEPAEEAIWK